VIFTSPTFYSLSTSVALFNKILIAGILKGDECLLRNTSGNVKIANLLKTIPEIIFKVFFK
jgi:hypothetical protein